MKALTLIYHEHIFMLPMEKLKFNTLIPYHRTHDFNHGLRERMRKNRFYSLPIIPPNPAFPRLLHVA
jgi:hypothetical protein